MSGISTKYGEDRILFLPLDPYNQRTFEKNACHYQQCLLMRVDHSGFASMAFIPHSLRSLATLPCVVTSVGSARYVCVCPYNGPSLIHDLENDFQFDRAAKRQARDAVDQTARSLVFTEDVLQ